MVLGVSYTQAIDQHNLGHVVDILNAAIQNPTDDERIKKLADAHPHITTKP